MDISAKTVRRYTKKWLQSYIFSILPLKYTQKQRIAFTLAEVLVALTLIGVISALTVSSLSSNILLSQNKAKIKKADSIIAQAVLMLATNNNGTIAGLGAGNSTLRNAIEPF